MSKTINRRGLKGRIQRGELIVKRNYKYTDDYAYDAATNYGETEFLPANYFPSFWLWLEEKGMKEEFDAKMTEHQNDYNAQQMERREFTKLYEEEKSQLKGMVFDEGDFRGYGSAWEKEDGEICLYFGYMSYTLKPKNHE